MSSGSRALTTRAETKYARDRLCVAHVWCASRVRFWEALKQGGNIGVREVAIHGERMQRLLVSRPSARVRASGGERSCRLADTAARTVPSTS